MRVLVIVAKYFGVPVRGIRLFVFGGVAELGGEPRKPIHEILIALGGPIVTTLLIVLYILGFSLILTWSPVNSTLTDGRLVLQGGTLLAAGGAAILLYLAMINTFVLLFNMIPAFPLDGGRVLRGTTHEALGKRLGFNSDEDVAKSIVRRNAIGQLEKLLEPTDLGASELLHGREGVGPTNRGTHGDEEDIAEFVQLRALHAWILDFGKVAEERRGRDGDGHASSPP